MLTKIALSPHHFDGIGVNHVVGLRRQRAVQADEVRRAQQFLQPDVPHQALQRRVAVLVIGQHGHAEAAADAGHGRADAPGAHDASGGAVQRVTQQAVQRKVIVAHLDVGFADAAAWRAMASAMACSATASGL